jgi:16S rRNA (uracil1498-N3)-methyltransferase
MSRRRFFVDEIHAGKARIAGEDAHHLTRVLRVERGQRFEISDNHNVYLAEVETARKDLVDFAVIERLELSSPPVRMILFASLIRYERFELLIEKATELGVETIVPVQAERSEKGLDRAAAKRLARWNRIAREASEQSRRARLPGIESPVRLSQAVRHECDLRYFLEEAEAPPILKSLPAIRSEADTVALLVGPEGGWTDRERSMIGDAPWQPVSLGPGVLKTETAALAALAVLSAAWQAGSTLRANG